MKNVHYFVFAALLLSSCASTKSTSKVPSPEGNWDYSITGTPEGDFNGVLTIAKIDDGYTAKMAINGGELSIEKYTYNEATMKMAGEFDYSGNLVLFDAIMVGDEIKGSMSAGGMGFPFSATRKQ
jgi:hypothetical protein